MAANDDLRLFFVRRRRFRLGLFARGDILKMLLAGELDASAMVRPVTDPIMRPLAVSELADLLARTGTVWREWGSTLRHILFLLALFLLNGITFLAVRGHADRLWQFTLLPVALADAAGTLLWLFLLWRVLLGSTRAALRRVLPLLIPLWNLYAVWPGFYALGSVLRPKLRRANLPTGPAPLFFAAVIAAGYLLCAAALPLLLVPASRTLAAVHELLLLGMLVHMLTLLLLFTADRSVMRLLRHRVGQMLDTMPMHALETDPRSILGAEQLLRRRTAAVTGLVELAVLLAGMLPLTAADLREAGQYAVDFVRSNLPQVGPETPGVRQTVLRETTRAAQFPAARQGTAAERLAALSHLADCLARQQEFYILTETQEVLNCGAVFVRECGELLGSGRLSPQELTLLAERCETAERRLRRKGRIAIFRTAQKKLADLPSWDPVRNVAILESAELLPECCGRDLYEFLPELVRPAGNRARAVAGRETARLDALSFFVRANTLILDFRLVRAAALAARDGGAAQNSLPRDPLTGAPLLYRETPEGFRIGSGPWPGGFPPQDRQFTPEITVKAPRANAE